MANLLSKFRLDYYSLKMVWISDKPQDSTIKFFDDLLKDFRTNQDVDKNGSLAHIKILIFINYIILQNAKYQKWKFPTYKKKHTGS